FQLEDVLRPGAGLGDDGAALDLEAVEGGPAVLAGLDADLLAHRRGHEQGRRPGIDDEVERALAVDLRPDQDVLGVGQAVRDLVGLGLGLLAVVGRRGRDEAEKDPDQGAEDSHARLPTRGPSGWGDLVRLSISDAAPRRQTPGAGP